MDDRDSLPIGGALIVLSDASREARARTGPTGAFAVERPDRGRTERLVVARLGFRPETLTVTDTTTALTIRLREAPIVLTPSVVRAEPSMSAASSSVIRQVDIALRPRESSQELLRLVPGLVIAQHAGGGKAEQIFLRGVDADHGTDVAISVDGVPVNMVSHAHGQGYADLHYLMPEVVDYVEVRKGPYDVRDGDFATAGAVAFHTKDRIRGPVGSARAGSFDTEHALVALPLGGDAAHPGGYVAASAHYTDGPFDRPQDYWRINGFGKWTMPLSEATQLVASASAFRARWNASGEIPAHAVARGLIDRFGVLDPSEGGNTTRLDLTAALRSTGATISQWEARVYAVAYRFQLFSDFTFFLVDTLHGDGIEQDDARTVLGGFASYGRPLTVAGRTGRWTVGAGVRNDRGDIALYHQVGRERLGAKTNVGDDETALSSWAQGSLTISSRARLDLGVRGDVFRFHVIDRLSPAESLATHPAGLRWVGIVSPKASLALDVTNGATLFANVGGGFHSNDARDMVLAPPGATVLPRALGAELGARYTWSGGTAAIALWGLDLASELVWSGDEGTTEANGRTRRMGIDLEARQQLRSWLWGDVDVDLARGRFRDEPRGADLIPLAPTLALTAGLTVRDAGPVEGALRVRHVGGRPANEDGSVRATGYTLWEVAASYGLGPLRLTGTVDNLLDAEWNEAQFATTSRLRGEPTPVTELHFTPGVPRTVQLGVEYHF